MALVSYDPSSSDDSEEDYTTESTANKTMEKAQEEFSARETTAVEKNHKRYKRAIKIEVPSLRGFENEKEEDHGGRVHGLKIPKTCGLFSILPPPKGAPLSKKIFIPNVVLKPPVKSASKRKPKGFINAISDDCGHKKTTLVKKRIVEPTLYVSDVIDSAPEPKKPYVGLDNIAFKELVNSTKTKRENTDFVDTNKENVEYDKEILHVKSMTDPNCAKKEEIEEPVNDTCRKKHHITYLAQKAKANEQHLQNQWSQNKYARKQTQAKYGF